MKNSFGILMLLCSFAATAQVGIGTTTPNASLDVPATNPISPTNTDGILIPRINAFPAASPTAAQNGMMVFLTTASGPNQPGFYYWDNALPGWKGMGGNTNGWALTGNAGTDPLVNFIGTTDDKDLVFKRHNIGSGKIGLNSTGLGLLTLNSNTTGYQNTAFGSAALRYNTSGNDNTAIGQGALEANTSGSINTAVGSFALNKNLNGVANTGMGEQALQNNTSGNGNVATGFQALFSNETGNYNTGSGHTALEYNLNGNNNAAFGFGSLLNNTSGSDNTAIGTSALSGSLTGGTNTAVGNQALFQSTGSGNTAIGSWAAASQTAGDNNIAIGVSAALPSPTASNQLSIGNTIYGTGLNLATMAKIGIGITAPTEKLHVSDNMKLGSAQWTTVANSRFIKFGDGDYVSLGEDVGDDMMSFKAKNFLFNPSGGYTGNVGIGVLSATEKLEVAGKTKTTNLQMTNGASAGRILVSDATGNGIWTVPGGATGGWSVGGNAGTDETLNFIGTTDYQSLIFKVNNNPVGKICKSGGGVYFGLNAGLLDGSLGNVGIGSSVLANNTAGLFNVAMGSGAMNSNVGGNYNVAVGNATLNSNATGNFNTAIGDRALLSNTQNSNTAIGHNALLSNTTGGENVAVGSLSQSANTTGLRNSALGTAALNNNTTGSRNTALGGYAMQGIVGGSYNTAVGTYAFNSGNFDNASAVGDGSTITASNQVRIGDSGVTSIGGFANWSNVSDKRFKKDIRADVPGLAFITKLNPVTYHLDMDAIANLLKTPGEMRKKESEAEKGAMLQTGFIAQEVEAAARESGYDFSGVDKPKNPGDFYGLRYAEFVVPLVKAVQEQQSQILEEKQKNAALGAQLQALASKLQDMEARISELEGK